MGFNCGIVGLPNVGKTTLFNALTDGDGAAENYPFCTIDPHVGIVPVPDARLDAVADLAKSDKKVATTLEFVDIAGLVEGASKGEGLGNQFLEHIRRTQAVLHVVRCFDDERVTHVARRVDPVSDIETIHTELMLADLEIAERCLEKANKTMRSGDKSAKARAEVLAVVREHLGEGRAVRDLAKAGDGVGDEAELVLSEFNFITAKPMLLVANVKDLGDTAANCAHLAALEKYAADHDLQVLSVSAAMQSELRALDEAERREFLQSEGGGADTQVSGLDAMIEAGYRLLDLLTFYTAGPKEARAWTVGRGALAPQAAGKIHGDFERGFICAETVAYDDFVEAGGWQGAKDTGKLRTEGKSYVVADGDVMLFRFNV